MAAAQSIVNTGFATAIPVSEKIFGLFQLPAAGPVSSYLSVAGVGFVGRGITALFPWIWALCLVFFFWIQFMFWRGVFVADAFRDWFIKAVLYFDNRDSPLFKGRLWFLNRPVAWIFHFISSLIKVVYYVCHWRFIIYIALLAGISTIMLVLELNQNDVIDAADQVMDVGIVATNGLTASWNLFSTLVDMTLGRLWNIYWTFIAKIIILFIKYLTPILNDDIDFKAPALGRQLEDSELPGADISIQVISKVTEVILIGIEIILLLVEFLIDFFLNLFVKQSGALFKQTVNLIKGLPCLGDLRFIECTLRQIVQYIQGFIILLINNLFLSAIRFFIPGVPEIPPFGFPVQCDSAPSYLTNEECRKCVYAFPGWRSTCPTASAGRQLIECNLINGTWKEDFIKEGIPFYTVHSNYTDINNGCPHTNAALINSPINYLKFNNALDCYGVNINGSAQLIACPEHDDEENAGVRIRTVHPGRRQLSYLKNVFQKQIHLEPQYKTSQQEEELIPTTRLTRFVYLEKLKDALFDSSTRGMFDCSQEHENSTGDFFNVMCGFQAIVLQKDLISTIQTHTESVASFYSTKRSHQTTGRRLTEAANSMVLTLSQKLPPPAKRRVLAEVVDTNAENGCPSGYRKCIGSPKCEIAESCSCPQPTETPLSAHETRMVALYNTHCWSLNVTPEDLFGDWIDCWDSYNKRDDINPLNGVVDPNKAKWCLPLIPPNSFKISRIERFSLRSLSTTCSSNSTNFAECVCPGYSNGIYSYNNAWWIEDVGIFVQDRLYNGMRFLSDTGGSLSNYITDGALHVIWSGFFGIFPKMPDIIVNFFGRALTTATFFCTGLHTGSFGYLLTFGSFMVIGILSFYMFVYVIADDFTFGLCIPIFEKVGLPNNIAKKLRDNREKARNYVIGIDAYRKQKLLDKMIEERRLLDEQGPQKRIQ